MFLNNRILHHSCITSIVLLILSLVASTAKGLTLAGPEPSLDRHTVEALTAISPLILTATIDKPNVFGEIELLPIQTLKAPVGFTLPKPFLATFDPINRPADPWPPPGTNVLIFLSQPHYSATAWEIYDFVVLDSPGARAANARVIRDLTLNPVPSVQAILDIVGRELRRTSPTTAAETYENYPFHLECLPADERLLPAARQWAHSSEPLARLLAISVMQAHPDPDDTPLLTSMLQDSYTYDMPIGLSPWSGHEYLVRQAAARALAARGVAVTSSILATPRNDLYQPLSLVPLVVLIALAALLYAGVRWLFWRKSKQGKLSLRNRIVSYLTFFCLMFSLLTIIQWHRSTTTVDDIVYARNGTQFEITSLRGFFLVVVGSPIPATTALVHLSVHWDSLYIPPDDRYFFERPGLGMFSWGTLWQLYLYRPPMFEFSLGLNVSKVPNIVLEPFSMRSGTRTTYFGRVFACTYQTLTLIFLAFPIFRLMLVLTAQVRRMLRNRRLRNVGLCPTCRYDLRAHHVGDRCPECGTTITQEFLRSPAA